MSAVAFDDETAREWVVGEVKREKLRSGAKKPEARRAVAGSIGIAPGTVENIERNRLKGLRGRVRDKIQTHKIRWFEQQLRWAIHELAIACRGHSSASDADIRGLTRAIEQAQARLEALRDDAE